MENYCMDCGKIISRQAKRCVDCANKKMIKPKKKCIDCGQELDKYSYVRCRECLKIYRRENACKDRYCVICGNILCRRTRGDRCIHCKSPEHRKKLSEANIGKKMPWVSESNHNKKGVKLPPRTQDHLDKIMKSNLSNGRYVPLGTTYIDNSGYVQIKVTHNHKYNYRQLHRVLMEKLIGRPLDVNEIVHHSDGNKLNNDIANLLLLTKGQHSAINRVITKINKDDKNNNFLKAIISTLKSRYPEYF
jgi:uncharacterized protein YajQ (UPF0234 family)